MIMDKFKGQDGKEDSGFCYEVLWGGGRGLK